MSKGNGSIRSNASAPQPTYTELQDRVVSQIAKGEIPDYDIWSDMSYDEKELALELAGFTGLASEDDIDNGDLYIAESRADFVSTLADDLSNIAGGYGIMDDRYYTFGYKDGSQKEINEYTNDFEGVVKEGSSFTADKNKVNALLGDRNLLFVTRTSGSDQPKYFVKNKEGMKALKKYGNFEEWKNGRGEKRRDYIQDDWI